MSMPAGYSLIVLGKMKLFLEALRSQILKWYMAHPHSALKNEFSSLAVQTDKKLDKSLHSLCYQHITTMGTCAIIHALVARQQIILKKCAEAQLVKEKKFSFSQPKYPWSKSDTLWQERCSHFPHLSAFCLPFFSLSIHSLYLAVGQKAQINLSFFPFVTELREREGIHTAWEV